MPKPKEVMRLYKFLKRSKIYTFPEKGKINVSSRHGVYIIYNNLREVLHVGNTRSGKGGLNQRLYNHAVGRSSFTRLYFKGRRVSLREKYQFRIIEVDSARTRTLLEALTIGLECPKHIGTGAKKKK